MQTNDDSTPCSLNDESAVETVSDSPAKKRRFLLFRRRDVFILGGFVTLLLTAGCYMTVLPGASFTGDPPPLTAQQQTMRDMLRREVHYLADTVGPRSLDDRDQLAQAAYYITHRLADANYSVHMLQFEVDGQSTGNLEVRIDGIGDPSDNIIIGAHYDTVLGSPGANDNASGVAALLTLAHHFAGSKPRKTLRFVAFTNEEPPYFRGPAMGSWVYANDAKERGLKVSAMISFDGIGFYTDKKQTQQYPFPLNLRFPSEGNFIAMVSNLTSRSLLSRSISVFREHATISSEAIAAPSHLPGVGWSDHWSFWECGYDAFLVTDTLPFRYEPYHSPEDTPEKLDYDRMARVVDAMTHVIADLAGIDEK